MIYIEKYLIILVFKFPNWTFRWHSFISVVCKYQKSFVGMLFMNTYIDYLTFSNVVSKVI